MVVVVVIIIIVLYYSYSYYFIIIFILINPQRACARVVVTLSVVVKHSRRQLTYQFEVKEKLSLFNWPVFQFSALLRRKRRENLSVRGSSYGHTQHFMPGKLT